MFKVAGERGIETLIRFARLASEAGRGASILPLLADALAEHVGADAVAVLEILEDGSAQFVASPRLPRALESLSLEPDLIGVELERALREACGGVYPEVHARPLVSGGGLFGSAVMFFSGPCASEQLALAEGLTDLAAIALESSAKLHELARSHAQLRASQEALARTEKLRALGQMAAGVSHDLNNILNPLSLHLQMAQRKIGQDRPLDAVKHLSEMKQVLTRGVQTIERLRDYSRQSREPRTELLDLAQLAREAGEIARPRMAARGGAASQIQQELEESAPVRGRSGEIVSALVNLVVNAIDALPGGGVITLRTGRSEGASWVQVADNGPGMPPEVEQRVFEPFFTTKGEEGTGLGLAMVYACMQRHGGSVRLQTAAGEGTVFTLCFPVSASIPPPPPG
jgi:signal transduction histidine kinase